MSSRTLAKLVRLGPVREQQIEDAPPICVGQVGGWEVIVPRKSQEGDKGVYFEIDSILPPYAPWTKALGTPRHIRTVKVGDVVTQGLFRHLRDVPPLLDIEFVEGVDVTELLGVTKRLDLQEDLVQAGAEMALHSGVAAGPHSRRFALPGGPPKTGEPRVQSNMELLKSLQGRPFYITLKYDGTSATYGYVGDEFKALSRNFVASKPSSEYWRVAEIYDLQGKMVKYQHYVVQGEIVGPGLLKNLLNLKRLEFRVFNVWDKNLQRFLQFEELQAAIKNLNKEQKKGESLKMVDVVETGDNFQYDLDELLRKAAEKNYPGTENPQEGTVVRSQTEPRVSFKVISSAYLIKYRQ